jgi:hypothetical protein
MQKTKYGNMQKTKFGKSKVGKNHSIQLKGLEPSKFLL